MADEVRIAQKQVIATEDGRLLLEAGTIRVLCGWLVDVLLLVGAYVGLLLAAGDRLLLTTGQQWLLVVGLALGLPLGYGLLCFHGWTAGCLVTGTRKVRELTGRMPGPIRMAWHSLVVHLFLPFLLIGMLDSGSTSGGMRLASPRRRLTIIRPSSATSGSAPGAANTA